MAGGTSNMKTDEKQHMHTHALVVNGVIHATGSKEEMQDRLDNYHDKMCVLFLATGNFNRDRDVGRYWNY